MTGTLAAALAAAGSIRRQPKPPPPDVDQVAHELAASFGDRWDWISRAVQNNYRQHARRLLTLPSIRAAFEPRIPAPHNQEGLQ